MVKCLMEGLICVEIGARFSVLWVLGIYGEIPVLIAHSDSIVFVIVQDISGSDPDPLSYVARFC